MIDSGTTSGERLCNLINHRILKGTEWGSLGLLLEPTGRSDQLIDFFRQVAAVTMTGRIVTAGTSYASQAPMYDPQFKVLFQDYLRTTVKRFGQRSLSCLMMRGPFRRTVPDWCMGQAL
jgi:hypothetical protein